MTNCPCCNWRPTFPSASELKLRPVGKRVYEALQLGEMTADELRKSAWPDGRPRGDNAIWIMMVRLDERLAPYGVSIARSLGRRARYRLLANSNSRDNPDDPRRAEPRTNHGEHTIDPTRPSRR